MSGIKELVRVLEKVEGYRRRGETRLALQQALILRAGVNALVGELTDELEKEER